MVKSDGYRLEANDVTLGSDCCVAWKRWISLVWADGDRLVKSDGYRLDANESSFGSEGYRFMERLRSLGKER